MSRSALVVGINTYSHLREDKQLTTPAGDAEAVAQVLMDFGNFQVRRLPQAGNENPDQSQYPFRVGRKTVSLVTLKKELKNLFVPSESELPKIKTALFYFAGHGLLETDINNYSYLATSDVNPREQKWGLALYWLRDLLRKSQVEEQIVWLDCCHSGGLKRFLEEEVDPKDRDRGIRRCIIAACRENDLAYEEVAGTHGFLTGALLKGLNPNLIQKEMINSYDLADVIDQKLKRLPQQPRYINSGGPIWLTGQKSYDVSEKLSGKSPYKGLEFFDYQGSDPEYFFGRTTTTDLLIERIKNDNFLAIIGSSGSGKSSVLRAGLIYQLNQGKCITGSKHWKIYVFQPSKHPLESLAQAFVELNLSGIDYTDQLQKSQDQIAQGVTGLRRIVQAVGKGERVVLAIDQFEEAFTLCKVEEERKQFFMLLCEALVQIEQLCIVITLRSDFLPQCEVYGELGRRIHAQREDLTALSENELRAAIVEPAKRLQVMVEEALVTQMLQDVDGPGSLPLLQFALTELWACEKFPRLTITKYVALGGVKGALQKRAHDVYLAFETEEQVAARRIFLGLTQLGEGTEDTRRQIPQSKLVTTKQSAELIDCVIGKLVKARLLVTNVLQTDDPDEQKIVVVDVAHEAIIRHWDDLRQWLKDYRDAIRVQRKIEGSADDWNGRGRSSDYSLQGQRLVEAREFLERDDLGLLSTLAQEFIEESQREYNRQEAERQRQQLETLKTQAALNTAEERNSILTQAKTKADKMIRRGSITLSITVLVALLLGGISILASRNASVSQRGTKLEQAGVSALRQFQSGELSALISAMHSAQELQNLVNGKHNPRDYPAISPILAIQKILDDINEQNYFETEQGEIKSAVFLSNDRFITAGEGKDRNNTLQIWNVAGKGKAESSLVGHEGGILGGVNAVSVGGDVHDPVIASAGEDETVRLWKQSGEPVRQLVTKGKNQRFSAIAVSPDGQKIIAGQQNGTVYLWEKSGKLLKPWVAHSGKVTAISFSRDGQKIATAGEDGLARVWTMTGSKLAELKSPTVKEMLGVSFSPDGQKIVTASDDRLARIWTVTGQEVKRLEGHQGPVTVANFSPDGQTIATASDDGSVKLWNVQTGQKLQDFRGHRGVVWSASFSPDGKRLVSAGRDGTVHLWNLGNKPVQQVELAGFKEDVNAITFSPDGKTIVGAGNEGVMRLWNISGNELKNWQEAIYQRGNVQDVAFSPDGKSIVASGLVSIARVWTLAGSLTEPQAKLKGLEGSQDGHQGNVGSVAVSPNSQLVATGSYDRTMRIWKPKSPNGELVAVTPVQESVISRVVFTSDGQRILTADWDGNVAIWNLDGKLVNKFRKVHQNQIRGLGITRDGSQIVTADKSSYVKILDSSGNLQKEFFSYQSGINNLTISPDGQLIATGGMDGTARLWDFEGRQVAEFRNPKGAIWGIAFSPDGRRIALAGDQGFASVKEIDSLTDLIKKGCGWIQDYLDSHPDEKNSLKMCQ